jgi:hypothetical protein
MPYITWPVGVPEYVNVDGYEESLADNLIETPMEQGPYKARRRGTARFQEFTIVIRMDAAQLATFEGWYYDTLFDGLTPFNWRHPRTFVDCVMQFRKPPPTIRPISGEVFDVQMKLELRPS